MVKIRFRERDYPVKEEKGWPIDKFHYLKIKRLRNQIVNMRCTITVYNERITIKKKFLNDIYDHLEKEIKKHDKKR